MGRKRVRGRKELGFTMIEFLVVAIILGILSSIALGTFAKLIAKAQCISSGEVKGLCFPEKEKWGACIVNTKDCSFPRPKVREFDQYRPPKIGKEVSGFYVRLLDYQSSAKVVYTAYPCSRNDNKITGEHPISTDFNDDLNLALETNYIPFDRNYCGFKFFIINSRHPSAKQIEFIMNFSVQ